MNNHENQQLARPSWLAKHFCVESSFLRWRVLLFLFPSRLCALAVFFYLQVREKHPTELHGEKKERTTEVLVNSVARLNLSILHSCNFEIFRIF